MCELSIPHAPTWRARSAPNSVMVWQTLNLFPWRNVIDNVAFGLEMQGVPKKQRYRAREITDYFGRACRI